MKSLKSKLMAAAAMLTMSAVMLTSASFAWFTVSTAPTIDSIEVTMTATNNLEIAKATDKTKEPEEVTSNDAGDETTWGGKVTSFSGAEVNFPATVTGSDFQTVKYDANGRTNGLETITITAVPDLASGAGAITHNVTGGPTGAKVAAVYGVWLRSNEDKTVTVAVGGTPTLSIGNDKLAEGKEAADAVKTFVLYGTSVVDSVSLTANEAKLVMIAVYVDGDAVIAKRVGEDVTISGLNVTFTGA